MVSWLKQLERQNEKTTNAKDLVDVLTELMAQNSLLEFKALRNRLLNEYTKKHKKLKEVDLMDLTKVLELILTTQQKKDEELRTLSEIVHKTQQTQRAQQEKDAQLRKLWDKLRSLTVKCDSLINVSQ